MHRTNILADCVTLCAAQFHARFATIGTLGTSYTSNTLGTAWLHVFLCLALITGTVETGGFTKININTRY